MNTLSGINYLHKMDNLNVLSKKAKRLPSFWMNGWQEEVDTIIHVKGEVSIKHLPDFVFLKTQQCANFDWSQTSRHTALSTNAKRKHTSLATKVLTQVPA